VSSSSETMATRGEARHLTTTGTMVGTAAYMSPEQIRAQELGGQTDLFSFEAVLYELSGCGMPFKGATPGEICGAFLHQQPKPPSQVIRHLVMQGSPFEGKSAFCRRLPLASCAKLLGIRASRRFDGFAARHSPGTKKL